MARAVIGAGDACHRPATVTDVQNALVAAKALPLTLPEVAELHSLAREAREISATSAA